MENARLRKSQKKHMIFIAFWESGARKIDRICLGRRLGGPKSQKMLPRPGAASKIEDRGAQDYPKEAESCPQIDPREAKGKQISPFTVILRGKSIQNH